MSYKNWNNQRSHVPGREEIYPDESYDGLHFRRHPHDGIHRGSRNAGSRLRTPCEGSCNAEAMLGASMRGSRDAEAKRGTSMKGPHDHHPLRRQDDFYGPFYCGTCMPCQYAKAENEPYVYHRHPQKRQSKSYVPHRKSSCCKN